MKKVAALIIALLSMMPVIASAQQMPEIIPASWISQGVAFFLTPVNPQNPSVTYGHLAAFFVGMILLWYILEGRKGGSR